MVNQVENTQNVILYERGVQAAVPIMIVVFIAFLVIGMALPVLPLYVHDVLKFGPTTVGIVAGGQFVASLLSRLWAGRLADRKGPKYAVILGIMIATVGGVFYLISCLAVFIPWVAVVVLFAGRTLLGGAESLIITGGMLWALKLVSQQFAGKAISWVGMSMFAALAVGSPIGSFLYEKWAFLGVSGFAILLTLLSLWIAYQSPLIAVSAKIQHVSEAFSTVVRTVALPGLTFALSGITFGAVTSFLVLYFSLQGWEHGAYAFTAFAVSLILSRIFFGHFPDKFGGVSVTFYCLIIQAIGLLVLTIADLESLAIFGAILTGIGFSLVFPSLGSVVVKTVPEHIRGIAMGTYNAFLDLTLGLGCPVLGILADRFGINFVFEVSATTTLLAIPMTILLRQKIINLP